MQLELMAVDESALRARLVADTGLALDLVITDNRSSMISFKPGTAKGATLRLHRMFLSAPPEVIDALGRWLHRRRCKRSGEIIDDFIKTHRHHIEKPRWVPKQSTASRAGEVHDIQALYDEVNREEFNNEIDAPIVWGKLPTKRRRRSIRLGSFSEEDHLIRIHPYLDQKRVPEFFVKYIVFHEMLHAHLGVEVRPSGRRDVHSKEFKRMERAYGDYDRAVAWQDSPKNLGLLLRTPPKRRFFGLA